MRYANKRAVAGNIYSYILYACLTASNRHSIVDSSMLWAKRRVHWQSSMADYNYFMKLKVTQSSQVAGIYSDYSIREMKWTASVKCQPWTYVAIAHQMHDTQTQTFMGHSSQQAAGFRWYNSTTITRTGNHKTTASELKTHYWYNMLKFVESLQLGKVIGNQTRRVVSRSDSKRLFTQFQDCIHTLGSVRLKSDHLTKNLVFADFACFLA